MADTLTMIWLNGVLCEAGAARIDPADRGLLLGDGLFETIAVRAGQARDVARHFARLQASAALLRIPVPLDVIAMQRALHAVACANAVQEGGLRLTLTRGPAPRGLLPVRDARPTLMIAGFNHVAATTPLNVIIAEIRRDASSPLSRIKSLNYLPNILARMEADDAGAQDAILLNHAGNIVESTVGNVFLKYQGKWLTPPVADGALPGICRAKLLEAGRVDEARIDPALLAGAEALCIGNVLSVRVVARVGGHPIPTQESDFVELMVEQ